MAAEITLVRRMLTFATGVLTGSSTAAFRSGPVARASSRTAALRPTPIVNMACFGRLRRWLVAFL